MKTVKIAECLAFRADKMARIGLFETPRFFLDAYCLEPGQAQHPHVHDANDKVYLVWEGRGRVRIGPEETTLDAGEAALAPAGVEHGLFNDGPARLVVLAWMAPHPRPVVETGGAAPGA